MTYVVQSKENLSELHWDTSGYIGESLYVENGYRWLQNPDNAVKFSSSDTASAFMAEKFPNVEFAIVEKKQAIENYIMANTLRAMNVDE